MKKFFTSMLLALIVTMSLSAQTLSSTAPNGVFTRDSIKCWIGQGSNEVAVVIIFNDNKSPNAVVWGYKFNGTTTFADISQAIASNDSRFYYMSQSNNQTLGGFGLDANNDSHFSLMKINNHSTIINPTNGHFSTYNYDDWTPVDSNDRWQGGWGTGYWYLSQGAFLTTISGNTWVGGTWTDMNNPGATMTSATYTAMPILEVDSLCPPPQNINISNITTNSATISWRDTISNNTSWYLYYKLTSNNVYDSVIINNDTSYTFNNTLISNSSYSFYLRTNCSEGLSNATLPNSFRTECGAITNLPYTENFDSYGTSQSSYPYCWNKISNNNYPFITSTNASTPGSLYMNASIGNKLIAITPDFDISIPINTLKVSMKLRKPTSANSTLVVGVIDNINDGSSFDSIAVLSPTISGVWQDFEVNFSNYQGNASHIAFKSEANNVANIIYMDNVKIDTIPQCEHPLNLVANIDSVYNHQIDLSWDKGHYYDNAWVVYYKKTTNSIYDSIIVSNTTNAILNNLNLQTEYNIYVKTDCGSNNLSSSSSIISIKTPCYDGVISDFPYNEGFENGLDCLMQEYVFGTNNWTISSSYQSTNITEGNHYAKFSTNKHNQVTKLILPILNLSSMNYPTLSFNHIQEKWGDDQDSLKILYRINSTDTWTEIISYDTNISTWKTDTIVLPNPSSTYQIAFQAIGNYGHGVGIDNIVVNGTSAIIIVAPSVTTNNANNITQTSAILNGSITPGSEPIIKQGFLWKLASTNNYDTINVVGTTLSYNLMNLTANTNYVYNTFVTTASGTILGNETNFSTLDNTPIVVAPSVTTNEANNITATSAILNGTITAGTNPIVKQGFLYKKTTNTNYDTVLTTGSNISYTLNNLSSATNYSFKAFASTNDTTFFGDELTFTTVSGINNTENSYLKVIVYPNPTTDNTTLEFNDLNSDAKVIITDIKGRIVNNFSITTSQKTLNINRNNLSSGIYYIKVVSNNRTLSKKLIIK